MVLRGGAESHQEEAGRRRSSEGTKGCSKRARTGRLQPFQCFPGWWSNQGWQNIVETSAQLFPTKSENASGFHRPTITVICRTGGKPTKDLRNNPLLARSWVLNWLALSIRELWPRRGRIDWTMIFAEWWIRGKPADGLQRCGQGTNSNRVQSLQLLSQLRLCIPHGRGSGLSQGRVRTRVEPDSRTGQSRFSLISSARGHGGAGL